MSAPAPISTVPARLPYLDRRALSEAWYAALHLARAPQREPSAARRIAGPVRVVGHHRGNSDINGAPGRLPAPGGARRPLAAPFVHGDGGMRLRPVATLGSQAAPLRAERAFPQPRAQVTLTLDGAPVRFIARRDGGRMLVIVLCGAAHVARVRRALGVLEGTLRSRGERLEAAIRTVAIFERQRTA